MKKSIKITLIVIAVFLLAATLIGVSYKLTNGFKKPSTPSDNATTGQLISTTIVTEKYGTFELPANSLLLSNNCNNTIFRDGTDFNFIFEYELERAKKSEPAVTDNSELIFEYDYHSKLSEDMLAGIATENKNGHYYFTPADKKVTYTFTNEKEQFKDYYPIFFSNTMTLALTLPGNSSITSPINVKFYCDVIELNATEMNINNNYLSVIISDKGCPLTDYIYNEIIADTNTIIQYNYKK